MTIGYFLSSIAVMKSGQIIRRFFFLLFVVSVGTGSAQAAFVSMDHEKFGTASLTLDTLTGFQWLGVEHAANRYYADVVDGMKAGGTYEGFRHATMAEVFHLLENFGFDMALVNQDFKPENTVAASTLVSYLGSTFGPEYNVQGFSSAMTADSPAPGYHEFVTIFSSANSGFVGTGVKKDAGAATPFTHWLIWEGNSVPVSEPGPYSVLLLGLIMISAAAVYRKAE